VTAAATLKANLASTIQTKIREKLQDVMKGNWVFPEVADSVGIAEKSGSDKYRVNWIVRPTKTTAAFSEGSLYPDLTMRGLATDYVEASLGQLGDQFEITDLAQLCSTVGINQLTDTVVREAYDSLDYQAGKILSRGIMRHRVDNDATYEINGTCTATETIYTQFTDATNFSGGANAYRYWWAVFTSPFYNNFGMARQISASSSGVQTVATLNALAQTSSKVHATATTAIAATDVVTIDALIRIVNQLEKFEREPFDDGMWHWIVGQEQKADMWSDSEFTNSIIYDRAEKYEKNTIGRLLDTKLIVSPHIYREAVTAGTSDESTTGVVYICPIVSKDMFKLIHWGNASGWKAKGGGSIAEDFALRVNIVGGRNNPDTYNPHGTRTILAWLANYTGMVTNGTGGIGLCAGGTALSALTN
jgi:hypothetical protein